MKVVMFSSDPNVFTPGTPAWERMRLYESVLEKLELIRLDRSCGRYMRFWKGYKQAEKILRSDQYDIIISQDIEHAFLARRLSKKYKVPFQMQLHTDIFSPYFWDEGLVNKVRVIFAKFLVPRSSCIRVVSERIERSLKAHYPNKNLMISVLPVFPAITSFPKNIPFQPLYAQRYDFIVLMVARLEREKNIPMALRAFAKFLQKRPHALLVIVGDGSQKKILESLCSLLGIKKNVHFEKKYVREYEIADVVLLTSNYEGYGLVALEAMHHGVPVIMTDVGVAGEVVRDGINGLVVPVGDEEKLHAVLVKYAENPALQEQLRAGAKNTPLLYQSSDEYRDKLKHSWETCMFKNA